MDLSTLRVRSSICISLILLITIVLPDMLSYGADSDQYSIVPSYGSIDSIVINEVFPDPDRDINGDGDISQLDEYIELFNSDPVSINLSNFSVSDNSKTFTLDESEIEGEGHIILGRWTTGLVLGRDDIVTLRDAEGTVIDEFEFQSAGKGSCYQRCPDGGERWTSGGSPTPGTENVEPPDFLINEVLPDPEGSNSGKQWVEILNKGPEWNLKGFTITNHDSLDWTLPSYVVEPGERVLLFLGDGSDAPSVPENVTIFSNGDDDTLYSSGDDLELIDNDGNTLDFLAYGNSTHVDRATGEGGSGMWKGKYYDSINSTMSAYGIENSNPVEGRSLMRSPDGMDTDSPEDLINGPQTTGGTPGWNNSLDPGIILEIPEEPLDLHEGETTGLEIGLIPTGSMEGEVMIEFSLSEDHWNITPDSRVLELEGKRTSIEALIEAPGDLRVSHECVVELTARWIGLSFVCFRDSFELRIPSFDARLEDMEITLDGIPATSYPEGSLISVEGRIACSGEIAGGNTTLRAGLYPIEDPGEPAMIMEMDIRDLKSTSKRQIGLELDTLGLDGNYSLTVSLDPLDLVKEPDEANNNWSEAIRIIPTSISDEMTDLVITNVLWNCSEDDGLVIIENIGNGSVDISGMRLSFDGSFVSFPDGSTILPNNDVAVAWGEDPLKGLPEGSEVFRADGRGPYDHRMNIGTGKPELSESDNLILMTEYRDVLDEVPFKRDALSEDDEARHLFPETTWENNLKRRRDSKGFPVDTDSSADWTVDQANAYISTIMIDPGTDGPGEFIGISPSNSTNDLSGLCICRNNGLMVIPDLSMYNGEELIISREPEDFERCQLMAPDLTFETGERTDPMGSCKVPGYGLPSLPNSEGEILLLDRGGRLLDSVQWGGKSGLDPEKGMVISRRAIENGPDNWRIVGSGSLPFSRIGSDNNGSKTGSATGPLPFFDRDPEPDEITVFIPGLYSMDIARSIMELRQQKNIIKVFLTNPPWERERFVLSEISDEKELALLKDLDRNGVKIFANQETVSGKDTGLFLSEKGILGFEIPPHPEENGFKWNMVIEEDTATLVRTVLDDITKQEGWFDISPLLGTVDAEDIILDENQSAEPVLDVDASTSLVWSPDPSRYLEEPCHLDIIHSGGPLDTATLLGLLRRGWDIDLSISSSLIRVRNEDVIPLMEEERKLLSDYLPKHRFMGLEENILSRIKVLNDISREEDLDLKLSMINGARKCILGENRWSWEGGHAYTIQTGMDLDIPCWVFVEGDILPGPSEKEGSNDIPFSLLPIKEEKKSTYGTDVIIDRIYFDTYLKEDPDEAVCLINCGSDLKDISGWMLTDDEGEGRNSDGLIFLPEGTKIGPNQRLWITRDGDLFEFQFGYKADLSMYNSSGNGNVNLAYGDMRLANSNDTVSLRDPDGIIMDVVPYGEAEWRDLWSCSPGGSWEGEAASAPGWGKILSRWKEWGSPFPEDRNEAEDFTSFRPRYPGQSDLPENISFEGMVQAGVCPDSGWELIRDIISGSGSTLLVNVYQMTSDWIASSLIGARERGVKVKVLLEGGPVGGTSYTSELLADRLTEAGIEVKWLLNDIQNDIRDRYRYDHAKYIIADGEKVLVSTDNFKDSSFPEKGLVTGEGTRGWIVSLESDQMAESMREIFLGDWEGPDSFINTVDTFDNLEAAIPILLPGEGPIESEFPVMEASGSSSATLLSCPDHISIPGNPLMEAILSAESGIDLELMDIDTDFDLGSEISDFSLSNRWGIEKPQEGITNPYLAALLEAASRGVKVRLLLDGSDFNGDGIPENYQVRNDIMQTVEDNGLSDFFMVRLHPMVRDDEFCPISLIHAKGMVIDEDTTWLSSFNFGPTSGLENREMGLLIGSKDVSEYYRTVFEHDWGGTLQNDLATDLTMARYVQTGKGEGMVEIKLKIDWEGDEELTVTAYRDADGQNGTNLKTVDPSFSGIIEISKEMNGFTEGDLIELRALSGDREIMIHRFSVEGYEKDERREGASILMSSATPVVLIGLIAVSISAARTLSVQIKRSVSTNISEEE